MLDLTKYDAEGGMMRLLILIALMLISTPAFASDCKMGRWEMQLYESTVDFENLNREQAALLWAIRMHEDGASNNTCGVEDGLARMYKDKQFSALMQMRWTVRVIKSRYRGRLNEFAKAYHNGNDKSNKHWAECVKKYMREWERQNPEWLR